MLFRSIISGSISGSIISFEGTWSFGDKKETLITTITGFSADTAVIIRLKSKELWIKSMDGKNETHYVKK